MTSFVVTAAASDFYAKIYGNWNMMMTIIMMNMMSFIITNQPRANESVEATTFSLVSHDSPESTHAHVPSSSLIHIFDLMHCS